MKTKNIAVSAMALSVFALMPLAASAQGQAPAQPAARVIPSGCPIEFKDPAVKQHIDAAYKDIGKDLPQKLIPGLTLAPRMGGHCAPPGTPPYQFEEGSLPSVQAFDQLYWVGSKNVGTWILKTNAGLVMFDAMNNSDDAEKIVVPGMQKLGLDPTQIKYILITHGHGDHFGGSKYLQDKYGAQVWVGTGDDAIMKAGRGVEPPKINHLITNDSELKVGSTTLHLYLVSGHTMGSIGAIFPVTDHGVKHVVGMFGGFGIPGTLEPNPPGSSGILQIEKSIAYFRDVGRAAGVDSAISTHPFFDDTITKSEEVANGRPAKSPWVIGKNGWVRYMNAFLEDVKSVEAMLREHPEPEFAGRANQPAPATQTR